LKVNDKTDADADTEKDGRENTDSMSKSDNDANDEGDGNKDALTERRNRRHSIRKRRR
jgi:hypothetical protein